MSIDCARVMRGISSSAKAVTPLARQRLRPASWLVSAPSGAISTWPWPQQGKLVDAVRRRHRPLDLEDHVAGRRRRRRIRHDHCAGIAVGLVGVGRGRARAGLDDDLFRAQRFQFLDGLGGRGHAGLVRPAFFENGDFHGALDRLETQKAAVRRTLHSVPLLCQGAFSPRGRGTIYGQRPARDTDQTWPSVPSSSPASISPRRRSPRFSESYEIAGHMDKPDPALVPPAAQPHVQAMVTHRQRRRLRRADGGDAAAVADLLLRHGL